MNPERKPSPKQNSPTVGECVGVLEIDRQSAVDAKTRTELAVNFTKSIYERERERREYVYDCCFCGSSRSVMHMMRWWK